MSVWGSRKVAAHTCSLPCIFPLKLLCQRGVAFKYILANASLHLGIRWFNLHVLSLTYTFHMVLFHSLQSLILTVIKASNTHKIMLKTCLEKHLVNRVDFPLLDL